MASSLLTTPLRVGKNLTDQLLDIDVPVEQTVTTVKSIGRGSEKKIVPDDPKKNIFRLKEEVEEPLNPSLKRAMGKAKEDPELEGARDIMPAPAKFFTPESRSYKAGLAKGLEKSGVELDLDFGNYVQFGGGPPKDVSGETFQNLFISPRLSYKKSTEKGAGPVQNKAQSTGNIYEGKALTDDDLRQNYKTNTGEKKAPSKAQINLLQPEKFKIRVGESFGTLDHPIVTVEQGPKHFYSFDMQVVGPVIMQKIKKDVQPNLRPSTIGKIKLGDVVGEIQIGKKTHPIYNKIEIDSTDSMPQDMQPVPKFNEGGVVVSDLEEFASKLIGRQGEPLILDENVGEDTGEVTKVGRPKKRTPKGETVSEKSTTIEIDGKHYNLPTIYGNKRYSDFVLKRALIEGIIKETSVHDSREEAEEAAKKRSKGLNQGGTAMKDQMQMAFMNEGGMKDDGGETEPTSGNKVPSGSLKEEVKDDIPAMLSEGEFVFPADVVRYIGLEKLMKMRQDAKQGLKMMEKMGQLGNPEEAELPDDIPFGMADLIVVSGEMKDKEKKAEGGAVGLANGGSLFDDPRFKKDDSDQDLTYTEEEKQEIRDALEQQPVPSDIQIKKAVNPDDPNDFIMVMVDSEGNPIYPLPEGYVIDDTPIEDQYQLPPSSRRTGDDDGGSDRESVENVTTTTPIETPRSTEDLAREVPQAQGKAYVLYDEDNNPIKLQKSVYETLIREYEQLGGDSNFGNFATYYNLPQSDKVALNVAFDINRIVPGVQYSNNEIKRLVAEFKKGKVKVGNPLYRLLSKAFSTTAASSGVASEAPKLTPEQQTIQDAQADLDALTGLPTLGRQQDETKATKEDLDKYFDNIAKVSQSPLGVTPVDKALLGIRGTAEKPIVRSTFRDTDKDSKTFGETVQKDVPLTREALGRIEQNRQDVQQRTKDAYSNPNLSLREREEAIHGMDLGNDSFYDVISGDFVANKGGLTPVENFYVGGVPTKPMKPQRLKKGGLAKPKAKPKKMKRGGLASSRKK